MNRRFSSILFILVIIFLFFPFFSCTQDKENRFFIDNYFQWSKGPDDGSMPESIISGEGLKKLAINQEKNLQDFFEQKKGYIWLRADFEIPENLKYKDLGLYIGSIKMAGQVFFNGKTIGTSGSFPPKEFSAGTAVNSFEIPYGFINQNDTNTLIIKLWTNSVGSISSRIYINSQYDVTIATEWENFFLSKLNLAFSGAMILIALFYFLMYLTHKASKEHLMFSILNFFSAFYLLPFYVSEVPWIDGNIMSYLWFSKLFSGVIAHIAVWFATSFMQLFLQAKESKIIKIARLIVFIIPCVMVLLAPTYEAFTKILPISFVFDGIQISFAVYTIFKCLIKKDKNVFVMVMGFSPVLVMLCVDFVVHVILKNTTQPYFTIMGWQCTIIAFLLVLSIRYGNLYKQFEKLNGKLEAEVEQRTLDLLVANKILKKEQDMAQRDMDMAVHIQKCFYPNNNQQFFGWDIAIYFQPQSGVSGDLYDFYENNDYLDGVGIFDVSGHGISAGLVTMLAKNIIRREYKRGVAYGKSLTTIMENINTAIISGKGNIENYLTGLVVKFGESYKTEECNCQLVNAGHPHAIKFSAKNQDTLELYYKETQSVGMIGINKIEVNFPCLNFSMDNEDVLVLFSDGLIEYENREGEDYGKEKIHHVLKKEGLNSSKKILNELLKDLNRFVGDVPQQDDITILVLKRKKDADYIPEL